jgi:hypothetical protein
VKAKQAICGIGDSWCPNLVHHFFRRTPEARWRETLRARSDISTLAIMIKIHELERLSSCALLPAPCSPWQRSRFRVNCWYFWLMITTSQAHSLLRVAGVFISFPLVRAALCWGGKYQNKIKSPVASALALGHVCVGVGVVKGLVRW